MKNNLENSIKQQLENREIPVSENAWDKVTGMMDAKPIERKIKPFFWMGIAASIFIVVGLFVGLNFFNPKPNAKIGNSTEILVQERNDQSDEIISNEIEIAHNEENTFSQNDNNTENIKRTELVKTSKTDVLVESSNENKFDEIINENVEPNRDVKEKPIIALNVDSISKPEKKINYVDPEMLLYSIENNQALQQKNSGSPIVIIDFNK